MDGNGVTEIVISVVSLSGSRVGAGGADGAGDAIRVDGVAGIAGITIVVES